MRNFFASCLILTFAGFTAILGFRAYIIHKADQRAEEILQDASALSAVTTSLQATETLYKQFGKDGYTNHQILARVRPYLTNDRLPAFLRIPKGSLALVTMEGWCDDAARALIYTLARRHIEAKQWNMQGPKNAHSAVLVELGDRTALLDPFYGYHTIKDGIPVSPGEATEQNALIPIDKNSNHDFYSRFDRRFMGAQGEPLTIAVDIPQTKERIFFGEKDKDPSDVRQGLGKYGMTISWEYVGHKYDRAWTRKLVAQQPLQIDLILTSPPDDGILRTFSPAPVVDGTKLTWNLLKGQAITSEDGKAAISWIRLNSYIDIDQITITPKGDTP